MNRHTATSRSARSTRNRAVGRLHCRAHREGERGVVLVEVLIALLIFMVGALGMSGYLSRAMSQSIDARMRTQAALLSNQYFAMLEAQMPAAARGADIGTYTAALNARASTVCSSWVNQVLTASGSQLPNASGTCTVLPAVNGSVNVEVDVTWAPRTSKGEGVTTPSRYVTRKAMI